MAQAVANKMQAPLKSYRAEQDFKGLWGFVKLWWFGFRHAGGDVNITVQRLLLPVFLRSIFTGKKVVLVFHHYDVRESLSLAYHLNYKLILVLLRLNYPKLKLVVVANYWVDFFVKEGVDEKSIVVFPNLFDAEVYQSISLSNPIKTNTIYLGQYGSKQHPLVFELANLLTLNGYTCVFSTNNKNEVKQMPTYQVNHYSYKDYLHFLATCQYTVCASLVNEGWNRTAHESLLLGTPVIGNHSGGLTQLLSESNQQFMTTAQQALAIITTNTPNNIPQSFVQRYHLNQISYYAQPIGEFCSNGIS
jgi:hypothetical protein